MKRILISCYYGQVIVNTQISTPRENVVEEARIHFQETLGEPIIGLPNLTYETESQWRKRCNDETDKGNGFIWSQVPEISI